MSAEALAPRAMSGSMLFMFSVVQVAKRLGLAKPIVRLALGRMAADMKHGKAFAGYVPTEHDVFVATFGKSGTNWMMQIAQQIAYRGEAEFDHIHDLVPWPDSVVPGLIALTDPGPRDRSPTGLRVIKTHLDAAFVPYDEKATYLTILRDPKEVLVSAYFFLGGIFGVLSHLDIDGWFDVVMRSDSLMTGWARHAASFWEWRDRPNVFVRGYGQVQEDPHGTIQRVAELMGVTLTEAQLARVVERSSFEYMKAHESQFAPPRPPFSKEADRPKMVRRGKSGASEEQLSRSQQAAIDRLCQSELRRLGSDFPYAEMFDVVEETGARSRAPECAKPQS